jgi:hypothetical protein
MGREEASKSWEMSRHPFLERAKRPRLWNTYFTLLVHAWLWGLPTYASSRGMALQSVQVDLEGDVDLRGFLGVSDMVRPGYREVRLRCNVIANAPREDIEELWKEVLKTSPVMDIISKGVDVSAVLEG